MLHKIIVKFCCSLGIILLRLNCFQKLRYCKQNVKNTATRIDILREMCYNTRRVTFQTKGLGTNEIGN